jgi:hypothetical protein
MSVNEVLESALELPYEEQRELIDKLSQSIKDNNLQRDPYFYERKEQITQTIDDIDSGKIKTYDWDEFEDEMDKFEEKLVLKYAN